MLKHLDETQQQLIKALFMVFLVFVLGSIGFKILSPDMRMVKAAPRQLDGLRAST
jgi:TctA family transporter